MEYTPASLLEMAVSLEAEGTYESRQKAQLALLCARYMEQKGMTSAVQIGPFTPQKFTKGQKVRVPAGALVRKPTHPSLEDGPAKRSYVVEVFGFNDGYVYEEGGEITLWNAEICWPGTGGYWYYTEATNVEAA